MVLSPKYSSLISLADPKCIDCITLSRKACTETFVCDISNVYCETNIDKKFRRYEYFHELDKKTEFK